MGRLRRLDAVVAGGGIVGMAAALALAEDGRRVLVLDPAPPEPPAADAPFALRVSTFSLASMQLLERLGAWGRLPPGRVHRFGSMRVWEDRVEEALVFEAADAGLPALGAVAENERVRAALREAAAAQVEIRAEPLAALASRPDSVRVELDGGERLEAELLLGADGGRSRVREAAGFEHRVHDYFQRGLVAVVQTARGHQHTAWQRFLPDGPLAFLPLDEEHVSIVWTLPSATARRLQELPEEAFAERLQAASQDVLGALRPVSPRVSFPLRRASARRYLAGRCVLLGDAAHQVHPLAGQGVNLGLLDVAELAASLREAPLDRALRRYERRRRSDVELMSLGLHALRAVYAWDGLPGRFRRLGTRLVGSVPALRRAFIRQASGQTGLAAPGAPAQETGP